MFVLHLRVLLVVATCWLMVGVCMLSVWSVCSTGYGGASFTVVGNECQTAMICSFTSGLVDGYIHELLGVVNQWDIWVSVP